ncbi:hypothetical protein A0Z28_04965 [Campylobacter lari]|uniref:hypothetical protein n=1 Tax=unclassified Campylobacter TaxID=2593542 RepID=UPI001283EE17|nr:MULTISPECIES: hypothetical protein [unclassified Campylobacter]EAK0952352.1 hypothetical protein [Campylobacter lari]MCV3428762.1 hypothetical protein [Campylobacter sp. IFREMER_LSEM_CL1904]MCV3480329.1 hypothetical protein [Campylobacter sp. CNRCH_2015_1657]HEC1793351.1 hypothetical protein [Campylobacter lari]
MLNMLNPNSNIRFHKCMPKEVHQIYDTLKLMEQEDTKKVEAEAKKEEQSNSTNTDKADNKKDQLLDIFA